MNFNCTANNFQYANSNEIADLHKVERILIPEEQVYERTQRLFTGNTIPRRDVFPAGS